MTSPSRSRSLLRSLLFSLVALPAPRGDGGVPDEKDKELQKLQSLLERKNGDSQALAAELLAENSKLRIERHGLREELQTTTAKVPAQGAVVLSGDDLTKWNALKDAGEGAAILPKSKAAHLAEYEKLGAPEALTTQLESGKAAFEKNARRERAEGIEAAAKFKMNVDGREATFNASLKAVAKDWNVVMREVEVTDAQGVVSKEQRPFVVTKEGEADKFTPLAERVKAEGEDVYRDMLTFEGENPATITTPTNGVPFPAQGGGNRGNVSTEMIDNFSQNRYGHVLPKKAA